MADPTWVRDAEDPRLADYRDLRRREPPPGVFVAEGVVPIRVLLASSRSVRSLLVCEREYDRLAPLVARHDVPVLLADLALMARVAGFDVHRGALAAAERWPARDPAAILSGAARVVFCEALSDLTNLGAVFRNAAALGADAVLIDRQCGDPLARRVVRVSAGHVLTVPWARAAISDLAGFERLALTPRSDAQPVAACAATGPVALLVGSEGYGLSAETLAAADRQVRIPMRPGVDSLNVATALAVALYALADHH